MTKTHEETNYIWEVTISVESKDYPVPNNRVRGEVIISGHHIELLESPLGKYKSKVFSVAYTDMKIPRAIRGPAMRLAYNSIAKFAMSID